MAEHTFVPNPNQTYPFNPATDIPSLAGKVILITGANTGLGKQTALELALHGPKHIVIGSRSLEKGEAAAVAVRQNATPGTSVTTLEMDLSSFRSIKQATGKFLALEDKLDILYLNAGLMGPPQSLTEDGYEIQMGINHVGHALLLKLLTPALCKSPKTRIVSVASSGYSHCDPPAIAFDSLKTIDAPVEALQRYTQSKLANILYARQFALHHPDLTIVSLNPGEVDTDLFHRVPGDDRIKYIHTVIAPKAAGKIQEGVKNHLWCGTNDSVKSGEFYDPVGVSGTLVAPGTDDEQAKRLWAWTQNELQDHET